MEKRERIDDLSVKAWRTFITVHANALTLIERELAATERIPVVEYDVLLTLWEAEGHRLRIYELAERAILSRSGLSRLIDRLEKQGLLSRERTSTDRRGAYAVLSDKGIAAMRRAWPIYAQGIKKYFAACLTDAEKEALIEVLERIDHRNHKLETDLLE